MTNLLESMYCNYQFKQTIETSTCVTDKTSTLIDHFATNRPSRIVKIGIVITGFSDHHMVFGMRKISGNRNKARKIIRSCNLKDYGKEAFRKDLANSDWESIMECSDIIIMCMNGRSYSHIFLTSTCLFGNVKSETNTLST